MPADTDPREVLVYLSTPCLTEDTDPLVYWRENQSHLSALAQFACKYLAMQLPLHLLKRIFSVAGKIFRPERCRFNDKAFEELLRIRCNSVAQ